MTFAVDWEIDLTDSGGGGPTGDEIDRARPGALPPGTSEPELLSDQHQRTEGRPTRPSAMAKPSTGQARSWRICSELVLERSTPS